MLTLVTGANATARETAIAGSLDSSVATAIILEGMASGSSALDSLAGNPAVEIHRIAPGCMCCVGNLTLRVTLNRILRHPPQRLFIGLANATHLSQLLTFLAAPPYDALLTMTEVMNCTTPASRVV